MNFCYTNHAGWVLDYSSFFKAETRQIRLRKGDSVSMFTPQIATAQSKTAESPAKSNARQRPEPIRRDFGLNAAERTQMLQRTIGNQAVLRLLAQEAGNRTADRPADKGPGLGSSWNFARIPIFPPGQAEHQQQRLPLTALPFRGVIQPKKPGKRLFCPLDTPNLSRNGERAMAPAADPAVVAGRPVPGSVCR